MRITSLWPTIIPIPVPFAFSVSVLSDLRSPRYIYEHVYFCGSGSVIANSCYHETWKGFEFCGFHVLMVNPEQTPKLCLESPAPHQE